VLALTTFLLRTNTIVVNFALIMHSAGNFGIQS